MRPPSTGMTRAGDVGRAVGGEEADDVADLARRAEAAQRDAAQVASRRAARVDARAARSVSIWPGAIELTVIPSGPSSRASVLAQPTTPGRTAFESARLSIGSRTELDSILMIAASRALAQVGEAQLRQPDRGDEQELDGGLDLLGGEPDRGPARRAAAVVDEDVDAAEGLDGAGDDALGVARVGDVAADGERADALRLALEQLAPAREHDDVGAFPGERLGGSQPDAGRGAADDRRPAL